MEDFWTDFNRQGFTCPSAISANTSLTLRIPLWRYRYMEDFPYLSLFSNSGSWHSAEIPLIFDVIPETFPPTPYEISTANYMPGAWSSFAKDPVKGLTKYGWPLYNPTQDILIRIANDNSDGPNLINPSRYDAGCLPFNVDCIDPKKSDDSTNPAAGSKTTGTENLYPSITLSIRGNPKQTSTSTTGGNTTKSLATRRSDITSVVLFSIFFSAITVIYS